MGGVGRERLRPRVRGPAEPERRDGMAATCREVCKASSVPRAECCKVWEARTLPPLRVGEVPASALALFSSLKGGGSLDRKSVV